MEIYICEISTDITKHDVAAASAEHAWQLKFSASRQDIFSLQELRANISQDFKFVLVQKPDCTRILLLTGSEGPSSKYMFEHFRENHVNRDLAFLAAAYAHIDDNTGRIRVLKGTRDYGDYVFGEMKEYGPELAMAFHAEVRISSLADVRRGFPNAGESFHPPSRKKGSYVLVPEGYQAVIVHNGTVVDGSTQKGQIFEGP